MSKHAIIISLNFNPGHVSHLVANYKQCEELGYTSYFFVEQRFVGFLPKNSRVIVYGRDKVENCDLAIFLFPAKENLMVIRYLKSKFYSKVIYLFHEPLAPMKVYRKAGFSYKYLVKLWIINYISALTVKWSDVILLPSKKAAELYESNKLYNNSNYHYLPLLFDDENTEAFSKVQRQYFSYIGTVAADHSFNEFLQFVERIVTENRLPGLKFLIATKSDFEIPRTLIKSSRVVIRKGKPLSNDEINECYASTYAVWNAYARTTQSGVLAKSFMFGTPVIVLRKNLSEFTEDRKEVVAIEDNTSSEQIEEAIKYILSNFDQFRDECRRRFLNTFYYRKYNEDIVEYFRTNFSR